MYSFSGKHGQLKKFQDDQETKRPYMDNTLSRSVPHGTVCTSLEGMKNVGWRVLQCWHGQWEVSGKCKIVDVFLFNIIKCPVVPFSGRKDMPPTIECQAVHDHSIEFGRVDVNVLWPTPTASDPEDGKLLPRQTGGPVSGSMLKDGNYLLMYEAKDSKGNTAFCSVSFNIYARHCPNHDGNSLYYLNHGSVRCTKSNLVGSVCSFTCEDNYEMKGFKTSQCLQDETWSSPSRPDCVLKRCPSPGLLENVIIKNCPEPYYIGSICHVQCHEGFQMKGDFMTCLSNRTWSVVSCHDVSRPAIKCPDPILQMITSKASTAAVNFELKGLLDDSSTETTSNYVSGQSFGLGKYVVVFTVKDKAGNEAKCAFNLTVSVQTCPPLSQRFASVSCNDSNNVWSSCSVKCLFGSPDVSDSVTTVVCKEDGVWSDSVPQCNVVRWIGESVAYYNGESATYYNAESVAYYNGESVAYYNGESVAYYNEKSCGPPTYSAKYHCPDGHGYGSVCRLVCQPGSDIMRYSTITCMSNERWSASGMCIDSRAPRFLLCPKGVVQSDRLDLLNFPKLPAWDRSGTVHMKASDLKLMTGVPVNVVVDATDSMVNGNNGSCKFQVIKSLARCQLPFYLDESSDMSMRFQCGFTDSNEHHCNISCGSDSSLNGSSKVVCNGNEWTYEAKPTCNRLVISGCSYPRKMVRGNVTEHRNLDERTWKIDCNEGFEVPRYRFDHPQKHFICGVDGQMRPMRITSTTCKPTTTNPGAYMQPMLIIYGLRCYYVIKELIEMLEDFDLLEGVDSRFKAVTYHIVNTTCTKNQDGNPYYDPKYDSKRRITKVNIRIKLPAVDGLGDSFHSTYRAIDGPFKKNLARAQVPGSQADDNFYKFVYEGLTFSCKLDFYFASNNRCMTCGKGSVLENGYCEVCPVGTYNRFDSALKCQQCPDGWRSPNIGLMSETECSQIQFEQGEQKKSDCERGFVRHEATDQCIPCPVGFYQAGQSCSPCPTGTWTLFSGSMSSSFCLPMCTLGSYSRSGLEPCYLCPKGKYSDKVGQKNCSVCPFGSWTEEEGTPRKDMCIYYDLVLKPQFKAAVNDIGVRKDAMTLMTWVNIFQDVNDMATSFYAGPMIDADGYLGCGLFAISFRRSLKEDRKSRRTWYHLVLVHVNNRLTLFVNGKEADTLPTDFPRLCSHIEFKGSEVMPELRVSEIVMFNDILSPKFINDSKSQCGVSSSFETILNYNDSEQSVTIPGTCDATDNCAPEPCGEHAVCIDLLNDYVCNCTDDFTGDLCKTAPDWCLGNQCKHSKQCINDLQGSTYRCDCLEGYSGKLCENSGLGDWTEWSEWEPCHLTCGEVLTLRRRECQQRDPTTTASCSGEGVETRICEAPPCPIDGELSEWLDWTCISDDEGGKAVRVRKCNNPEPEFGGDSCWQPLKEFGVCDPPSYRPIDGGYGPWSDWSYCQVEENVRTRVRLCENPAPKRGGKNCTASEGIQTMACEFVEKKGCWKLVRVGPEMKRITCTEDPVSQMTECVIECKKGYMVDNDKRYLCGPLTNYTWSHITRINPKGLLPHCTIKQRTIPVKQRTVPVDQCTVTADQRTVPANQRTIPVNQRTVPVNHRTVPVDRRTVPIDKDCTSQPAHCA
ncbi:hypothetical protein Btru_035137, partial [Bulinus truncatus]